MSVHAVNFVSLTDASGNTMEESNAHRLIHSAHQTAVAFVSALPQLTEQRQTSLYEQILVSLLKDNVGRMSTSELFEALCHDAGHGLRF
ncbi:conserved hypothetical protein [Ricinus communis]|uniref:Uncharacterized protein n=1 Tax=Ricinus communis TaxID=3988 RepID=B9T9F7_RICCO|nr:conserved hypothetical protein [Ricinus communis]